MKGSGDGSHDNNGRAVPEVRLRYFRLALPAVFLTFLKDVMQADVGLSSGCSRTVLGERKKVK